MDCEVWHPLVSTYLQLCIKRGLMICKKKSTPAPPDTNLPGTGAPSSSSGKGMARLILNLIRPYRGWLTIVFVAMLIETAMSIAAPVAAENHHR